MILSQKKWIVLDRRLIQLKIEREALKKESDDASVKRLNILDDEISELSKKYSDLEEIWHADKASLQGTHHIKEELEQARIQLDAAHRQSDLAKMSELQYGVIPELEKRLQSASGENQKPTQLLRNNVSDNEIAEVVSRWTGIPVAKMLSGEQQKLLEMEVTFAAAGCGSR